MPESHQIMCINKTNRKDPHERIQGVGGLEKDDTPWYITLDRAIEGIEEGTWRFYTNVEGEAVWVIIATHNGHKYLKTEADGLQPNNLLSLPECPLS